MLSAIIGNGFIANKHRLAIEKMGWEYLGAYDVVPSRSTLDFEDLNRANVIHICTPNAFHVPYMRQFAHKKLVIEKPISTDLYVPDVDACVCYQRRFDKQAMVMKDLCDKEKPNKIYADILVPRDNFYWETWRGEKDISGGGALMNIGIHYVDLLQWWLGEGEVIKSEIGYFGRVMDESAYVKFKFGKTEVEFHINARHNVRSIRYVALWDDRSYVYDTDEATHYELLKGWVEGRYVTPKESLKSLELMLSIYANSSPKV